MSLEDKFYPEDGSLLTSFDNSMIKLCGKVGQCYQELTGKSYKNLVKASYLTAIAGFGLSVTGAHVASLIMLPLCYLGLRKPEYESPLEEEIRYESKGGHRKLGKGVRLLYLVGTAVVLYLNFGFESSSHEESTAFVEYFILTSKLLSLSLIPYAFAEYLTKSDIPKPPKKTVIEKIKEAISSAKPESLPGLQT